MKAVVKVGGKQYIVTEKETLLVDLLPEGTKELSLDALMVFDGKTATVGAPFVKGTTIKATVLEPEVKGDKLRVIRFESKKRVKKVTGHRQKYSRIEIGSFAKKEK
jgi:large subunit ribosomal protein L21